MPDDTPDTHVVPDEDDADASTEDHLAVQTDNAPTPDDGDQADIDQDPADEGDVDDEDDGQ